MGAESENAIFWCGALCDSCRRGYPLLRCGGESCDVDLTIAWSVQVAVIKLFKRLAIASIYQSF